MYAVSKDERTWGMFSHLSALVGYFVVPFGNIIAPLIIWLVKRDESQFVADQAKESLNFQISLLIYGAVGSVICLILMLVVVGFILIFALWGALYIGGIVLTLVAAIKANEGQPYRYPFTIRLVG
ncbi:MAG: DUF4870 domain-containing protein [Acidobacteriota bacterium]